MTIENLQQQYNNVPNELKNLSRWVCWNLEERDGQIVKMPINPISGARARVNDDITWNTFDIALLGCVKYNCKGLGFMLGEGIFGVDLDNHEGENSMSEEEFNELANEFISTLQSYAEKSQSGKGIHIICKGKIPEGRKRKGNVEMYDGGRFFAFTGNVVYQSTIKNCEKEIIPLWEKYINVQQNKNDENTLTFSRFDAFSNDNRPIKQLNDNEVLNKAFSSKNGHLFAKLWNGDTSNYRGDHSSADMALCMSLAFWTNCDRQQIDRLFRQSSLMRPKWDELRGRDTYGNITIDTAIQNTKQTYIAHENILVTEPIINKTPKLAVDSGEIIEYEPIFTLDKNGDPIFREKKIFKKYSYTDTGNAERFYDYFGDIFRYNKENKEFMIWTGRNWASDSKDVIRKYANKFIEILKEELKVLKDEYNQIINSEEGGSEKKLKTLIEASEKNITRVSNKAGKDAMLYEFQSLYDIPIINDELDTNRYILNTNSGVYDLENHTLMPYDPKLNISKNTNVNISYEEPIVWKKFLNDIFERGNPQETKEIIDCLQMALGYSLSGSTKEQVMFVLWGDGSNGKSTFSDVIVQIMGDYGTTVASEVILSKKNGNENTTSSTLARLKGIRYISLEEVDEDSKLAEGLVKRITGSTNISARQLYGKEFTYLPEFKIWLSCNDKPIIRGNNFGIWRRIFMFPFIRKFTEKEKDKDMPDKLKKELPQILGWVIQGYNKYVKNNGLEIPKCMKNEIDNYKMEMDVVSQFIEKNCVLIDKYLTPTKQFYSSYKNWAINETEFVMKNSKFEEQMRKKGYKIIKDKGVPKYVGIKLNSDDNGKVLIFNNYDEETI